MIRRRPKQPEKLEQRSIMLPPSLWKMLEDRCEEDDRSKNYIIEKALLKYLGG